MVVTVLAICTVHTFKLFTWIKQMFCCYCVGDLQALCLTHEIPIPTYTTTKEEGPSHDRYFEILCSLNKHLAETGSGRTKKQAKKEAGNVFKNCDI